MSNRGLRPSSPLANWQYVRGDREEIFLAETLSDHVALHLECGDICCAFIGKRRGFITILVEVYS